jgi:hypothetical protein
VESKGLKIFIDVSMVHWRLFNSMFNVNVPKFVIILKCSQASFLLYLYFLFFHLFFFFFLFILQFPPHLFFFYLLLLHFLSSNQQLRIAVVIYWAHLLIIIQLSHLMSCSIECPIHWICNFSLTVLNCIVQRITTN